MRHMDTKVFACLRAESSRLPSLNSDFTLVNHWSEGHTVLLGRKAPSWFLIVTGCLHHPKTPYSGRFSSVLLHPCSRPRHDRGFLARNEVFPITLIMSFFSHFLDTNRKFNVMASLSWALYPAWGQWRPWPNGLAVFVPALVPVAVVPTVPPGVLLKGVPLSHCLLFVCLLCV